MGYQALSEAESSVWPSRPGAKRPKSKRRLAQVPPPAPTGRQGRQTGQDRPAARRHHPARGHAASVVEACRCSHPSHPALRLTPGTEAPEARARQRPMTRGRATSSPALVLPPAPRHSPHNQPYSTSRLLHILKLPPRHNNPLSAQKLPIEPTCPTAPSVVDCPLQAHRLLAQLLVPSLLLLFGVVVRRRAGARAA